MNQLNIERLQLKVRHFLLQNSEAYKRSLKGLNGEPSLSQVAKELHKKCGVGERRLRRYLSEDLDTKSLSITIDDLNRFRELSGQTLIEFLSYLTGDNQENSLSWWQTNILGFFDQLDLDTRRKLHCTIFDNNNFSKSECIFDIMSSAISLEESDINLVSDYVNFLHFKKKNNIDS